MLYGLAISDCKVTKRRKLRMPKLAISKARIGRQSDCVFDVTQYTILKQPPLTYLSKNSLSLPLNTESAIIKFGKIYMTEILLIDTSPVLLYQKYQTQSEKRWRCSPGV